MTAAKHFQHPHLPHALHIGAESIAVRDLSDASCAYQDEFWSAYSRDTSATLPDGTVTIDATQYRIDQNARVWNGNTLVMEAA